MDLFSFMKGKKYGFWGSLVRNNTGVSALNWFLIMSTLIGLSLLVVVMFCMIWEVVHNNSITSDISGWAAFVAAVATFLAPAGLAKGWSNWSENKFLNNSEANLEHDDEEDLGDPEEPMEEALPEPPGGPVIGKKRRKNSKKSSSRKAKEA